MTISREVNRFFKLSEFCRCFVDTAIVNKHHFIDPTVKYRPDVFDDLSEIPLFIVNRYH